MNGLDINKLANLLKETDPNRHDSDSDDDQPKKTPAANLTPASFVSQAQKTGETIKETTSTPAKNSAVNSKDIWHIDEVPDNTVRVQDEADDRTQPEYEMHYKQRITTEDVFLQMGNKNSSSASCEDLVVNIQLPNTKLADIILDITKTFLDCRCPKYRLALALPHPVDPDNSQAKWEKEKYIRGKQRNLFMSSEKKRCSSGASSTVRTQSISSFKQTSSLSRSKTCGFAGATSLKSKPERLQPLVTSKTSQSKEQTFPEDINSPHPAMVNELCLHARALSIIPDLSQFTKLQILDLSCNDLIRIENLRSLSNLRELKLYGNQIERIENLECLSQLQNLQLQYNEIQTIGFSLVHLTRLQSLRIDSNKLSSIRSEEVSKLVQLKSLDISDCSIENLDFLGTLSSLAEFRACNCSLKSFSSPSRTLRYLFDLDLSENQLQHLTGLKSLTSLRILRLANNNIQDIQVISCLIHLNELDLNNNQIICVPNSLEKLLDLQCLRLSNNRLQSWKDIDVLRRMNSLFILNIDGNAFLSPVDNYVEKLVEMCPTLEIIDDISLNNPDLKSSESNEQLKTIDRELREVDQTLERSMIAAQNQFDMILNDLQKLTDNMKSDNSSSTNKNSKHRLFQALTFSEENYSDSQ